jgi:DnaK suppressor protein
MASKQEQNSAATRIASASPHSEQRARQLRELLAGVRSQETQRMRAIRERSSLESSTIGDEGDSAQSDEGFELTASLAALAGTRAAAVESALERLRDGRYGVCEECEEEIPVERLQVMPWTVLCVDCQRERENASRHAQADLSGLWVAPNEAPSIGSDQLDSDSEAGSAERGGGVERRRRGRPRSRPAAA